MNSDVSNEVWEIAKDLYDNDEIDCDVNRYGQVEDVSFDMEYDEYNEYYQDCNEADFEKAKEYLKQLLIDTKYYTDYKRYLELSDNHTFWDIEIPEGKQLNYDDEYGFVYDQALRGLSEEIGTDVYGLGRSGRHICVDDTFENLTKLNEFKVAQAKWEKWFIDTIETQLATEDANITESLHNGEMTADCLNCGKTIVYTKKDICNDIDGDYIECPSCHATFDVECNNDKCKVSESYEVWQRYYEDGMTTTEYVQSFDTYEKAQKFADGLNEDPDCEAWVKSLKENKMTEGLRQDTKEQRLTGDETYVARNSSGYKSIGLIIDNTNKQFQIINGQVMTTDSKTKKMSKKQIRDKAQQLYDNGYTEYDGYGSVAQGVNKKEEAIDWVGDTKVNDNGTVTIDGRERTVDSIKAEIKSLRDELKRSKEAYSNKQISKHQRSYDKFRYTRQIEKLKAFLDLLNTNSTDLEEDCTQASGVDAGKVTLFGSDEKDKKEEAVDNIDQRIKDLVNQINNWFETNGINKSMTYREKENFGVIEVGTLDEDMYNKYNMKAYSSETEKIFNQDGFGYDVCNYLENYLKTLKAHTITEAVNDNRTPHYIAKCKLYDPFEEVEEDTDTYLLLDEKTSDGQTGLDIILAGSHFGNLMYNTEYEVRDLEIVKTVYTLQELIDYMETKGEDLLSMVTDKGIPVGMQDMLAKDLYRYVLGEEGDPALEGNKEIKKEARLTDYLGILQIRDILQKNPDTANKEFAIKDNMIVEVGTGDDVANYKAIKNDDGEWELLKENLTTTSGEYNTEEYNKICDKLKQAYKDAWDNKISYAELENIKRQSGLSNAELTSIQYTASRETDKKEELITEDINTAQTITEKLNTGVLPIVDTDMYSINDRIPESATREGLDEIVQDIAPKYLKEVIQEVLPSVEIYAEGVYHPKQYNYSGDELEFELVANKEEYEALREKVTSDANFNAFLRNKYKSYDGFVSYMADDTSEFGTQDTWKQLVQVIMFALKDKVDLEAVNNEYLDEFLDRVHTEFGWDDEEDDLEESKKEELFDNNINASISTGDISSNIDLGGIGDLLGLSESQLIEAKKEVNN